MPLRAGASSASAAIAMSDSHVVCGADTSLICGASVCGRDTLGAIVFANVTVVVCSVLYAAFVGSLTTSRSRVRSLRTSSALRIVCADDDDGGGEDAEEEPVHEQPKYGEMGPTTPLGSKL